MKRSLFEQDHDAFRESARELLAPYALGALTDDEARALRQMLLEWPEGRAELAQLIAAADVLPLALTAERPSMGLEWRIIAKARERRRPRRLRTGLIWV